jgi:crotonobetainyl-CoA:carnitine CoA-transferase CaiB-like acyl-CoA transferase
LNSDGSLGTSLKDIVVVEIGDQMVDHAGLLLAGLGAEVIKLEPPGGSPSRSIGPYASATPDPEQSIFFWRYNLNKKSVVLDVDQPGAFDSLQRILAKADILLMAGEFRAVEGRLEQLRQVREENPRLITCAITPFGLDGPWRELKATDLTQMALGGVMAVCGYDPDENLKYDTPPIAPAMWHSYHISGEYAAIAMLASLNFCDVSGEGQLIDVSVHEAVSTCTELAMPTYIYNGETVLRQTSRHAAPAITQMRLGVSADGVYMLASLSPFEREERAFIELANQVGIPHILGTPEYNELEKQDRRAALTYRNDIIEQVVASLPAWELFEKAQAVGLAWAPIRRPEENLEDRHFAARGSFAEIHHPELRRTLRYPRTVATDGSAPHMHYSRRAPRLGEHTDSVFEWAGVAATKSPR